jgi:hypothetical protein
MLIDDSFRDYREAVEINNRQSPIINESPINDRPILN